MKSFAGILSPAAFPGSAERAALEKQTRFNPLRGFTPDVLVRQLESYHGGEIAPLAWVMEWLEKHDDVIATVAPKAKAAVAGRGYDVLLMDEIPASMERLAEDQRGFCQEFFQNLQTSDAVEQEEQGGMRLYVQQILDAYGKGYAAHHIIWRPSKGSLTAELVKVPTWFFEVTTGRMKYLATHGTVRGVSLADLGGHKAWACYRGRGVMLAGCLARMFKQLPLQDWLTYCDRHGMPAFLGQTTAQKGSPGWDDMAAAVAGIGSEFGAVINQGDMIKVLDLAGNGELPYEMLVDRMDRALVMMWRGGDLSTMSRANGTGSNPQQEDSDELDSDNAVWVSEQINRTLTSTVLEWKFGPSVPVLCRVSIRPRPQRNLASDLGCVEAASKMGYRVSIPWFVSKFGLVEADANEAALGESEPPARR